ncbi:hypothetical protein A2Z33_02115 [Candidatus Gottesmanbacteria bacterium RBG_16_52_11]|uniref:Uncharacterized protein n=1 Tax=Candidatus Gottesmanbacteria bacterium RBG_16_52_11 TaxID=1798374 RepID=A0A1F5YR58_9BACT|nr:MAG: hypothetical protein A2Z33_02115 [Candidatus Gottesmanbacteria bacterium RBG_16_52_11]
MSAESAIRRPGIRDTLDDVDHELDEDPWKEACAGLSRAVQQFYKNPEANLEADKKHIQEFAAAQLLTETLDKSQTKDPVILIFTRSGKKFSCIPVVSSETVPQLTDGLNMTHSTRSYSDICLTVAETFKDNKDWGGDLGVIVGPDPELPYTEFQRFCVAPVGPEVVASLIEGKKSVPQDVPEETETDDPSKPAGPVEPEELDVDGKSAEPEMQVEPAEPEQKHPPEETEIRESVPPETVELVGPTEPEAPAEPPEAQVERAGTEFDFPKGLLGLSQLVQLAMQGKENFADNRIIHYADARKLLNYMEQHPDRALFIVVSIEAGRPRFTLGEADKKPDINYKETKYITLLSNSDPLDVAQRIAGVINQMPKGHDQAILFYMIKYLSGGCARVLFTQENSKIKETLEKINGLRWYQPGTAGNNSG